MKRLLAMLLIMGISVAGITGCGDKASQKDGGTDSQTQEENSKEEQDAGAGRTAQHDHSGIPG